MLGVSRARLRPPITADCGYHVKWRVPRLAADPTVGFYILWSLRQAVYYEGGRGCSVVARDEPRVDEVTGRVTDGYPLVEGSPAPAPQP